MNTQVANIKTARYCAFCKYWWDPSCSHIEPQYGTQWRFDTNARCRCIKRSVDMEGIANCSQYRCKVEY